MNWKRYLRIRHFMSCAKFAWLDISVCAEPIHIQPKTLLIVRLEAIGDYIFVRNFLESIRLSDTYKDFKITLCGNELWRDLAETYDSPFVDEFIWVNKKKFGSDTTYRKSILSAIHAKGFEYAIQPNYSREFLWGDSVIRASSAKYKIGTKGDNANDLGFFKWISDSWFTTLVRRNSEPIFEFTKNKIFFEELLQISISLVKPTFNLVPSKPKEYIIIFPGAGELIKQWSPQNFAKFILEFRKHYSLPIYICGAKGDSNLAEEILANCQGIKDIINHCGQTNLPQLVRFIQESNLLLTNDSSAFHIGAALDVPTVCLFSGRHYGRFAPYPKGSCLNLLTLYPKSFELFLREEKNVIEKTKYHSPSLINEIEPSEVLNACNQLLNESITAR
ncbi:MAG: hypothetical protein CFE21_02075 [Bacteroidetes bacterium B1(2017)]|nr:MAG: hypothetical protein CFE21_02075 [Bacteroidetes bacterium B1(2017)]